MSRLSVNLQTEVQGQHQQIGVRSNPPATGFQRTEHPQAQWFAQADWGLFIHWGLSCVLGQGDLSWSMMARTPGHTEQSMKAYGLPAVQTITPPAKYWDQARSFNPDRYDPKRWLEPAAKAGAKYAAITTRHHDGFALWPSDFGDFNTKNHMGGRDLVGEFVDACRQTGLKVGLYYSPPDWYFHRHEMSFRYGDAKPALGLNHEPIDLPVQTPQQKAQRLAEFQAYLKGQIEELLTRYGKIDLIWFDGDGHEAISIERIRQLQPSIVLNGRAHGQGDFQDSECVFPKTRPCSWWDYCHVWADGGWAYLDHETYKPMGWFLSEMAKARSWSGNWLPSVGPDAHGQLPEVYYKRMEQLARWMQHSGPSVTDVQGGPWPERCNVPVTCRSDRWYAHLDWVFDPPVVMKEVAKPKTVRLLRTQKDLAHQFEQGTLTVSIPQADRTNLNDVIEVVW